jgi:hypothetical protein
MFGNTIRDPEKSTPVRCVKKVNRMWNLQSGKRVIDIIGDSYAENAR